jgi:DNA-binding PadR family transcriptional regulator
MERKGWLSSEWGLSEKGRQAKFYQLTRSGRAALTAQVSRWSEYTRIVELVLEARAS